MAIQLKSQNVTNMYTPIELVTTNISMAGVGGTGGVTDHGYLHGLADNDHPQYMQTANSSLLSTIYQKTSDNSLSLGTAASQSFIHTSNASSLFAKSNSTLLYNKASYTFAESTHIHGNVSIASTDGSSIVASSASNGLTLSVPLYGIGGALSNHSHGSIYFDNVSNSTETAIRITSNSSGMTFVQPNFLTTAYGGAIQGSGSYTQNTGTIQFSNANGVTFGLGTDGIMTASIPAIGGAQTGVSGIADSATTFVEGTLHFVNSNGVGFGLSTNGSNASITASYTVPGATVFSNSNNVEFGLSGSTITALANFSVPDATVFSNSNNVSFGLSGSTVTASATFDGGNKISISGNNTTGTLTQITSGTVYFAGGNNVTLSQDGNSITIIGAAQGGVQTGISGIVGSNATFTSGSVIMSAQANVTIGSFATSNSQYIRFSVGNYITTAAASDHTHGTNVSTATTSGVDIKYTSASNGLTMGIPAYLTTAMQSASSSVFARTGFSSASTGGTDIVGTLNTNGLSIGIPKYITTAAVSTHTHGSPTLTLSNLSGSVSSASNGLSISITGYPATSFVNASESGNIYFINSLGSNITWGSSSSGNSTSLYATAGGGTGGGVAADWTTATKTGSDIQISTGATNTLHYGNFLTTAAQSSHTHDYQSTGAYLTTAANSTHTHSDLYQSTGAYLTTQTVDTQFAGILTTGVTGASATLNSSQLQLNIPQGSLYYQDGNGVSFSASSSGLSTTLSAYVAADAINLYGNVFATDLTQATGDTIGLSGGNFITLNALSGSRIRIDGEPGYSVGITNSGNTGGTSGLASRAAYLIGSNNITLSQSIDSLGAATISIYGASGGAGGVGTSLSTVSTNGSVLTGALGSDGMTLSVPAWLTAASGAGADGYNILSAGSQTAILSGTVKFEDSNGVTWGMSNNSIITAAYSQSTHSHVVYAATDHTHSDLYQSTGAYLTTAAATNHTHSDLYINTSKEANFFLTANSSLLQPSGAYLTTAMQSASSSVFVKTGATTGSTSGTDVKITANTDGVSILIPPYITDHANEFWIGASNTTWNEHTVFISAQTNITVGTSENGDSQYVRLSVADAIPLGNSTAYNTTVLSSALMPLGYSSGFQTATLANTFAQTGHSHGNVSLSLSNLSGTYSSASNGMTLSLTGNAAGAGAISVSAGTLSATRDSIVFSNSNNVSFGMSGSTITGSIPNGDLYFTDSNGFSWGSSVNGVSTSLTQNYAAPRNIVFSSNTSGTMATISSGTMTIAGGANITLSQSGNAVTIIGASGGTGGGAAIQGSGTYSQNSGTIQFANSNNVTFGLTNNQMTASIPVGTVNFVDSNGVTWSSSVGTGASSLSTSIYIGNAVGGGAALKGSGTYSQNTGTVEFANSNGITFGLSNNGTMTASGAFAGTATSVTGNVSITAGTSGIQFNATNLAGTVTAATGCALTVNTSGVSVSVSAATGSIYFGDIAGYSWTSTTAASKTTFYLKTS